MINQLPLIITIMFGITTTIIKQSEGIKHLDTNGIVVEFDPYVSPLDSFDQTRYTTTDLLPLISKVATRFSKIFIRVDITSFFIGRLTGMSLAPFATAKYNCLPTTRKKLEVLLAIYGSSGYVCHCELMGRLAKNATSLALEVNQECSDTVSTIFLPGANCMNSKNLRKCMLESQVSRDFKWGLIISCENQTSKQKYPNNYLNPAILAFEYYNEHKNWTDCVNFPENRNRLNTTFAKIFGSSDTGVDNVMNTSRMIASLRKFFSGKTSYMPILSKAFDTYEWIKWNQTEHTRTNGWWYLAKDSAHGNTSEYVFEEKITNATKTDFEEDPKNFEWLRSYKQLNKSLIGVLSQGKVSTDLLLENFNRILVQDSGTLKDTVKLIVGYFENRTNSWLEKNFSLIVKMSSISDEDFSDILQIKKYVTIIVPIKIDSNGTSGSYNKTLIQKCKELKVKYGYAIIYGISSVFSKLDNSLKNTMYQAMSDTDYDIFVFEFPIKKKIVNLGARRMVRYVKSWMEPCINLVQKYQVFEKEIMFTMSAYHKNDQFYQSVWAMQNFVKYVYLLQNWASEYSNVAVYIEDETDFLDSLGTPSATVGWFSREVFTGQYVRIKDLALQMSEIRYSKPVNLTSSMPESNIVLISVFVLLAFLFSFVVIVTFFIQRYRNKYYLSKDELATFFKGSNVGENANENSIYNLPYDKSKYEVEKRDFQVLRGPPLGIGEFGQVFNGTITCVNGKMSIAIKMNKQENNSKYFLKSMLAEIKVLIYLGNHDNITQFLGANTASLKAGKIYIFTEFCERGSLEKNLREMHSLLNGSIEIAQYEKLYRWSTEICNGMAYLAEKYIIHGDLAARNVLLNFDETAKICDFGLSRRLYNYSHYVKTGQEPLPWKWMAPESLNCNVFSEKSDIWAFGVTLWEIYSLGTIPYPGLSWEANFANKLEEGFRLPEPPYNKENIYGLMKNCWNIQPEKRPTFSQIKCLLTAQNGETMNCYTAIR